MLRRLILHENNVKKLLTNCKNKIVRQINKELSFLSKLNEFVDFSEYL